MEEQIADDFDLGVWLGRRQAFAAVAGVCSAGDAQSLKTIRDEKLYRARGYTWDEFCKSELHIPRRTIETVIAQYEEFGTPYFQLAGITRLSPDTYRLIEPAVTGNGLKVDDEVIEINAGNAAPLAAAVETLRQRSALPPTVPDQLAKAEKIVHAAIMTLDGLSETGMSIEERARLVELVTAAIKSLQRVAYQTSVHEL